jgi:hypothetical protein
MADFGDIKNKNDILNAKGAELLKVRQERLENRSVTEVKLLEKLKQDQAEIDKLSANITQDFDKKMAEITRLSHRINEAKNALAQAAQGRIYGAEKSFQQGVRTSMSPSQTLSDIAAASRQSSVLGGSIATAQSRSTSEIEDSIARNKVELARRSEAIRETAVNVKGNEGALGQQMIERQKLIQQIAQEQAALSAQRKMGIDITSQYYKASDVTAQAQKEQELGQIKKDVEAGKFGSRKQVEEQLEASTKRLIATFGAFDAAIKSGAKNTNDLAKKFEEAQKEYDRQKSILKEMGGGGPSGIQVAAGIIGNLGTVAQGVGQAYRHIGVTSENTQQANRIGFAQLANTRFDDVYGATQGNMSALRRVTQNSYAEQVQRGLLMGGREDIAKLIETAGSGAKAVGTTMDTMTGPQGIWAGVKGFFAGGNVGAAAANVTAGLAEATPDAVEFAKSAADYSKNNTQAATFLQSANQQRQMQDTLAKISDFTSQTAADYNRNLTVSTRGLGGGRGGLQSALTNPETISALAEAGIGIKDIPGLVGAGRSALGRQFGMGDISKSAMYSQAGYFDSPEQFMQARGAMSAAGGTNKDLEDILKNAVANGMDASKNIMEMVQATTSLSQRSAAMGINVFGGAAAGLGKGIDALRAGGVSENMATVAAQNAANFMNDTAQSRDLTLDNVIETARLRRAFPDAKLWQMEAMQTVNPAEARELRDLYKKGDTSGANKLGKRLGIGDAVKDLAGAEALFESTNEQATRSLTGFGIDRGLEESVQEARRTGRPLTDEEQAFVNSAGRRRGVSGEAATAYVSGGAGARQGTISGGAPGGIVGGGEKQISAAAVGDAKLFADGVENFNKAIGGLANLGDTMKKITEVLKPEEFSKATAGAAKEFNIPVNAFGKSVTQFDNAVGKLVDAVKDMLKNKPTEKGMNDLLNQVNMNQVIK